MWEVHGRIPSDLDDDGSVDCWWLYMVDIQSSGRTGWVVSVTVVTIPVEPRVLQQGDEDYGIRYGAKDGSPNSWVGNRFG